MNLIQSQTSGPIFHNWLTADDFRAFAQGVTKSASSKIEDLQAKVDAIFADACKRGSTYETVVHNFFCSGIESAFGTDETAPEFAAAFEYARAEYDYMNANENAARQQADAANGLCHHGLDEMTCPCGCFEFSSEDEDEGGFDSEYEPEQEFTSEDEFASAYEDDGEFQRE